MLENGSPNIDLGVIAFGLLLLVGLVLIGVVVVRLLVAGVRREDRPRQGP